MAEHFISVIPAQAGTPYLPLFGCKYRRALTLVEMLVGMAITLVMMAAVVNLFANISEGVRNRRATMEVSANLRIARTQLFNDLAGATCLKYPKNTHGVMPKPDSNNPPDGYFEIVEGEQSDERPGGGIDPATSLVPSSSAAFDAQGNPVIAGEYTDGRGRGDYDDILAMTVESESTPFRGKGRGLAPGGDPDLPLTGAKPTGDWTDMAITSPVAEVVWFAVQTPLRTDPNYLPEMGEPGMRKIYRRTLLVVPWYGSATNPAGTGSDPLLDLVARGITDHLDQLQELRRFQEEYDISLRLENGRLVPNSLADLARREHRFAHSPNNTSAAPNIAHYPHHFPYDVDSPNFTETPNESDSSLRTLGGERGGEDLILRDVLAFDVQVFDPGAPLYNYQGTIVSPSSSTAFISATTTPPVTNITGFGAYVDLGWNNGARTNPDPPVYDPDYDYVNDILPVLPSAPAPLFQQERRLGWHPMYPNYNRGTQAVYDTWTTYYETDQSNQELAPFYSNLTPPIPWAPWQTDVIDQGANGLDENAINGPDDPLERETSPPYPSPLYGVQVKLRVYEPESRQIRETTVTRNLAK